MRRGIGSLIAIMFTKWMCRFARPQAEVEVEEAMKLRIAAAYKNAKMQKLLRKRRAQ